MSAREATSMRGPWKKIVTREYAFLYASYAIEALKIMEDVVGTTLNYDLFHGQGPLLTIYRIEQDIQRSYDLIESMIRESPLQANQSLDRFEKLIKECRQLMETCRCEKRRSLLKQPLIDLDKVFLQTLCHYLFCVFLGYAADRPVIAAWLADHMEQFTRLRNDQIDQEMNLGFPVLFGRYNPQLQDSGAYLSRQELLNALDGGTIDRKRAAQRRKEYLLLFQKGDLHEFFGDRLRSVLAKEVGRQPMNRAKELVGRTAAPGKSSGRAIIVLTTQDYEKIRPGVILVTPMTKPSIEPYLSGVAAIVTNDGGALSHASIIARERAIPCVVGTVYATDVFQDGDLLEVDADRGMVRKLND